MMVSIIWLSISQMLWSHQTSMNFDNKIWQMIQLQQIKVLKSQIWRCDVDENRKVNESNCEYMTVTTTITNNQTASINSVNAHQFIIQINEFHDATSIWKSNYIAIYTLQF